MDASVTVRFYRVDAPPGSTVPFVACMQQLMLLNDEQRARSVSGVQIGLTNLLERDGLFSGDIYRTQSDNFPSLIVGHQPKSLELPDGSGLGHHTAFIFDTNTRMLGYQITKNSVSMSYFNTYIANTCECSTFVFLPVIKKSELKALNTMRPRTLVIKVADPADLEAVEDEEQETRNSLINLQSIAGGAYIKVAIGMGNVRSDLSKGSIQKMVGWLLEQRGKERGKVQSLKLEGKTEAGLESDALNFIRVSVS